MKVKNLRLLFENSHGMALNMNDTFYYACADFASIDTDELEDLEPVIDKYGYEAVIAFEAIKRGHDPQIPDVVTKEFKESKAMILNIMDTSSEFGAFFTLKRTLKQKAYIPKERSRISKLSSQLKMYWSMFTGR